MRTLLFFLLIALFSSLNTAKAQELDEIHQKIQKNWAFPDCGSDREILVLTRHYLLGVEGEVLSLAPYSLARQEKNAWTIDKKPAALSEDGILTLGEKSYTGCAGIPKAVPKALQRLTRYIDRIKEQCTVSLENDCARVLFKMADENSDKKLGTAEIKKGVLTMLLFAELADQGSIDGKETREIAARAKNEGPKIADDLLARYDADKSKSLDYNEMTPEEFTPPETPAIRETLLKTGKLIPLFKITASAIE
jgi:hypothetical protein